MVITSSSLSVLHLAPLSALLIGPLPRPSTRSFHNINLFPSFMAGGIIQLVAYGAEDIYLTANSQITFFKIVYRRHTNFSTQVFERTFLGESKFGKTCNTKIYRLGDLATTMFLRFTIPSTTPNPGAKFAWVRRIGLAILKSVRIDIGGQTIDKQYNEWINVWIELSRNGNHELGYLKTVGDVPQLTEYNDKPKPEYTVFIPILFWFNKYPGLALPLVALQYHDVIVYVEFNKIDNLIIHSTNYDRTLLAPLGISNLGLLVEYVYLELAEREKFTNYAHEYLIEQTQTNGETIIDMSKKRIQLNFNHPIKELIWMVKNGNYISNKQFLTYSTNDWPTAINNAGLTLLHASYQLLKGPTYIIDPDGNKIISNEAIQPTTNLSLYTRVQPQTVQVIGLITVINNSPDSSLWFNPKSLLTPTYSLTEKLSAVITVGVNNEIVVSDFKCFLDDYDISIPIEDMIDTRVFENDVIVNQYFNFGLLITSKVNPIEYALLEYNDQERIEKRDGKFFGTLQPYIYHNNTPSEGVNLYSFAEYPAQIQPSGTSNLSRVERVIFTNWVKNELGIINKNTKILIFALNYNILRVMNGLAGLAYPD